MIEDDHTLVTNTSKWRSSEGDSTLHLDGEGLELLSLQVDGKDFECEKHEKGIIIHNLPNEFTLEIKSKCHPKKNTSLEGLYCSNDMYCTQCEPEGFRKITYHMDRSDVMSIFTTKIIARKDKYPILLSNGNLIDSGTLENNLHYATWEDPFKKPSYLFAMVAGSLICVEDTFMTMSNRIVKLKLYVEREPN